MGADASPETLWYFAYGSNMSSAKFTGSRGVVPLDSARAFVPHWMMTMEIPGLPYSEPAFGSLKPRAATSAGDVGTPDVIGVAYLITAEQYRHVIASEGGGTAYSDVEIAAKGVSPWDQQKIRNGRPMRTLGSSTMTRAPPAAPSLRYMNLLIDGAAEAQLPSAYQVYLESITPYRPSKFWWTKVGASLFLAQWGPVMALLEKITVRSIGPDGNAPSCVVCLVRTVMAASWFMHDWIFAPIFGPGDGRDDENRRLLEVDEKRPLIGATYSERQIRCI